MLDSPASRWRFLATVLDEQERSRLNDAKHADLPWDVVFSTDLFDTFKPNPKAYLSAAKHLSLEPSRCAMVASHLFDLRAAGALGLRTVYIPRAGEESVDIEVKRKVEGGEVDIVVQSLEELASIIATTKRA
ncbi:hypothetical protein C0991_004036 [Blastosporella zonata]|nr:hypothetical protein C0991_004036 [Blastosporella zonata]